ncbi:MAG: nodulation protein NfeD [Candidatus Calescibacterium sp.]|nr:nodulation protein NfeD [Candidatus Calescibacterium sp.]MCX7734346.1 nodulation protein NfeD [bacterium]
MVNNFSRRLGIVFGSILLFQALNVFSADEDAVRRIIGDIKKRIEGVEQGSNSNSGKKEIESGVDSKKEADTKREDEDLIQRSKKAQEKKEISSSGASRVYVVRVDGAISPAVANFIVDSLEEAMKGGASLFIILLDTPGGLDPAMRDIIRAIEASYVPVCVFVWPVGARAASAGTFITASAHIAAMAPGTSIGAASPVLMGGERIDEKLRKKIENDAIAYIRAIAQRHKRNPEALEKTVREAATFTSEEALKNGLIDIIAESVDDLIKKVSGRKVTTSAGEITINIQSYEVVRVEPNIKHKVLKVVSDPNIAYILMTIGIWGIFFELANPGAVFPGVIGAICLVLGLYSLQALPVNWAGLALILLAIVFFLLEVKLATSGILALAGILSMFLGSIMLFDSPEPIFRASYKAIISTTIATALFFIFVAYKALSAQRVKSIVGFEGLIDQTGVSITDFQNGRGKISVSGEIWDAQAVGDEKITKGERIKVVSHKGMTLLVKKESE